MRGGIDALMFGASTLKHRPSPCRLAQMVKNALDPLLEELAKVSSIPKSFLARIPSQVVPKSESQSKMIQLQLCVWSCVWEGNRLAIICASLEYLSSVTPFSSLSPLDNESSNLLCRQILEFGKKNP